MKFDILSDIHLELLKPFDIALLIEKIQNIKKSDILCLLGDIGLPSQNSYQEFLKTMLEIYPNVILLAGNHEYYSNGSCSIPDKIRTICNELNQNSGQIHFLDRDSIVIDGIKFIGCTLWSEVKDSIIAMLINDYHAIKVPIFNSSGHLVTKIKLTIPMSNMWHERDLKYLTDEIGNSSEPVVVLTHHAPITDQEIHPPEFRNLVTSEAYCTDLTELIRKPVVTWCWGHTHQEYHKDLNGILLHSNPLDYKLKRIGSISEYFTVDLEKESEN
jgi:predicted phosphodiesterase